MKRLPDYINPCFDRSLDASDDAREGKERGIEESRRKDAHNLTPLSSFSHIPYPTTDHVAGQVGVCSAQAGVEVDCGTSLPVLVSPGGGMPSLPPFLPSFIVGIDFINSDPHTCTRLEFLFIHLPPSHEPFPSLSSLPFLPPSFPPQGILLAEYFNLVMHNFIYYLEGAVWGEGGPPPPLKDLGIMLLEGIFPPSAQWIVGLFLYFLIGMMLTLCLGRLLLNNVPWGGPQTVLIKEREDGLDVTTCSIPVPFVYVCKRACQVLSIAIVCRVLSYTLTLEPNPAAYCHPPHWDPPNTIGEIMGRVEVTGSCGDLLFSSHTLHGMVMMLTVLRHAPYLYVVCGIAVCSMAMLIITLLSFKNHYSHDIVTGKPVPSLPSLPPSLLPSLSPSFCFSFS